MGKLSDNQIRVLGYIVNLPGGKTTAFIFNQMCGNSRTVRAMFANGLVKGDEIPARYVSITPAGRAALSRTKEG